MKKRTAVLLMQAAILGLAVLTWMVFVPRVPANHSDATSIEGSENVPESFRAMFAAELETHGDVVVYLSPSRQSAWVVSEGRTRAVEERIATAKIENVKEFSTSRQLGEFMASLDPRPGDERTYVNADCQRRNPKCKDCFPAYPDHKEDTVKVKYGQCERIDDSDGECTETYAAALCDRQKYSDSKCTNAVGKPEEVTPGWWCSAP